MNTEQALVRLLLQEPRQIIALASKGFNSSYFKNKECGKLYNLILDRYSRFNSPPTEDDLETVKIKLTTEPVPHTLEHCVANLYNEKINELMRKALLASGEQLINNGPEASMDIVRQAINAMPRMDAEKRSRDVSETSDDFLTRFHNRQLNKGKILGLRMGFPELDMHTKGLMPQWLTVIQGRNGQFKSWVLSHMIKEAFVEKKNILVFSCEMSLEEFESRIHALALDIPPRKLDLGEITSGEYTRMQEYLGDVKDGKFGRLIINDSPSDLDMISMEIDKILQKYPLDAIVIDAAYGLAGPGKGDVERLGNIAKGCKQLAKKYELPVVVTIQANRDFAKANPTAKKETTGGGMSAFGSDAWNQYADLMFIIHRTPDHEPFNYSDLIMDKFRHGPKLDTMLKINLAEPCIVEVDRAKALARINGENPAAQSASDELFAQTNQFFTASNFGGTPESILNGEDEISEAS